MTLSQAFTRHDAAVSEYKAAAMELATRQVFPLEILVLAETRRRDPKTAIETVKP